MRRVNAVAAGMTAALMLASHPADARIRKIVIEKKTSPAFEGRTFGAAGQYEVLTGKAYGELDPNDPHNAHITDIKLAPRNAAGKVEYTTTFQIVKPIDMSKSSRLLWHDVPNRGGRITIGPERDFGDIGLSSGWQGDAAGRTVPGPNNDYVVVPVAKNADGTSITGQVMGRIMNAAGAASHRMFVASNPNPYRPASLDTTRATLIAHTSETLDGTIGDTITIPSSDWAWAKCSPEQPFPGTPDPTEICLKGGFDPKLLYRVVFTAQDPPVLGIGFAAFRDMSSFFKNAKADDDGTPNPVAGQVQWVNVRGVSQSGNFVRALLQLGFTQDEANRKVYDGAWPIIAGRRVSMNARWAMPDGVLTLFEPGSEGPQWWAPWPDEARGLGTTSLLDRCTKTNTCPKIFEHFGAAEVWALKMSAALVGTAADKDIPLPANVRRYYFASTQHGGGRGGFSTDLLAPPSCPSTGYGTGSLAANPMPQADTVNALRVHFRNWVMNNTEPPASRWPRLSDGTLVEPTKEAMGFPTLPGLPPTAPTGLVNPLIDYDFGPGFDRVDASGIPTIVPPAIKKVLPAKVPKVNADGNELGGVPVVLLDAPLGTYLGWTITSSGFFQGQLCNYAGGMIPFAKTKAERDANKDPRPSLEERYRTHEGYVQAVEKAAARAMSEGFLLKADADRLIKQAQEGNVLR